MRGQLRRPKPLLIKEMGDLLPRRRAPRILVVDDQPSIAGLMSQLLSMRGYDVTTASNAEQAEAEVRRQLPDLILSDRIRVYHPELNPMKFFRGSMRQAIYYGYGIFKGAPNPFHVSLYRKFNPLQAMTYQII